MNITFRYGRGFVPHVPQKERVGRLKREVCTLPQYEPQTQHYFHGGMYCREVWRDAGVTVIGRVHRKEHFYLIVSGTVAITTDDGEELVTGPRLLKCKAGTERAVFSVTPARCMTFHICQATTVEEAERELVEEDEASMYLPGNLIKDQRAEVLT